METVIGHSKNLIAWDLLPSVIINLITLLLCHIQLTSLQISRNRQRLRKDNYHGSHTLNYNPVASRHGWQTAKNFKEALESLSSMRWNSKVIYFSPKLMSFLQEQSRYCCYVWYAISYKLSTIDARTRHCSYVLVHYTITCMMLWH